MPDYHVSGTLVLTDCYLLNHWWIAILQARKFNVFYWYQELEEESIHVTLALYKVITIWFSKRPKKPPDPQKLDWTMSLLLFIEDTLYFVFKLNIDLPFWIGFISDLVYESAQTFAGILLQVDVSDPEPPEHNASDVWIRKNSQPVSLYQVNERDRYRFWRGKVITSNIVLSFASKRKTKRAPFKYINSLLTYHQY